MNTIGGVAGFWSYSHQDDERDNHGVTRLASRISDEFALVTGETLTLFVDRNDIRWGDEWRRRINAALAETTFFIPIITPLYFKREECIRELVSFVGQAQSLGAVELVMPILYIAVPGLSEDSTEEARALIARMHYIDWREIRLSGENSSEYRRGVHEIAMRLAEISTQYEQRDTGPAFAQATDEEEGIIDLLAALEGKMPGLREVVDKIRTAADQLQAITDPYAERLRKGERAGVSAGAKLSIIHDFSVDAEPVIRRTVEAAEAYSSLTIDIDPVILTLFRKLETFPELVNVETDVLRTLSPIPDIWRWIHEGRTKLSVSQWDEFVKAYKGMSKDLARISRLADAGLRLAIPADALVENWNNKLSDYQAKSVRK
jgi:hypothetical protein